MIVGPLAEPADLRLAGRISIAPAPKSVTVSKSLSVRANRKTLRSRRVRESRIGRPDRLAHRLPADFLNGRFASRHLWLRHLPREESGAELAGSDSLSPRQTLRRPTTSKRATPRGAGRLHGLRSDGSPDERTPGPRLDLRRRPHHSPGLLELLSLEAPAPGVGRQDHGNSTACRPDSAVLNRLARPRPACPVQLAERPCQYGTAFVLMQSTLRPACSYSK